VRLAVDVSTEPTLYKRALATRASSKHNHLQTLPHCMRGATVPFFQMCESHFVSIITPTRPIPSICPRPCRRRHDTIGTRAQRTGTPSLSTRSRNCTARARRRARIHALKHANTHTHTKHTKQQLRIRLHSILIIIPFLIDVWAKSSLSAHLTDHPRSCSRALHTPHHHRRRPDDDEREDRSQPWPR
jgi:hypothetical protein